MYQNESYQWGRYAWYKFHKKALEYPDNPCRCLMEKTAHFYKKDFLKLIHCPSCIEDYKLMIKKCPIRLGSKHELFEWTVDIHNMVNRKLGKEEICYSEAYRIWDDDFKNQCCHCSSQNVRWILMCDSLITTKSNRII
ncbi:MAG: ERV1/ALR-related protein [Nitrososphaerota archaeon]